MIEVVDATLRDMSYVLYNLNPADEEETACQIDPQLRRDHLAYMLLMSGDNFAVRVDGQPAAVFGTAPLNRATLSVWALGTKNMRRVLPAISRHLIDVHLPKMVEQGYRYMEARSHANHASAHRWLRWLGATVLGEPHPYGRNGELFLLFRWTSDDLGIISQQRSRRAP
jgi:hypothetical protein